MGIYLRSNGGGEDVIMAFYILADVVMLFMDSKD